jgi:hypothetical protein
LRTPLFATLMGSAWRRWKHFAYGRRDPKLDVLQGLAKEFFNARLIDDGMLVPVNRVEPRTLCPPDYPPKIDPKSLPTYSPPPRNRDAVLARMPRPANPVAQKLKGPRPGACLKRSR